MSYMVCLTINHRSKQANKRQTLISMLRGAVILLLSLLPPPQTPVTYSAASTADLEHVVKHVKGLYPRAPVLGAGVSLGG